MKISYDYTELLSELRSELLHGILSPTDNIKITRSHSPIINTYKPIIDWYYIDDEANELTEVVTVQVAYDEMEQINSII